MCHEIFFSILATVFVFDNVMYSLSALNAAALIHCGLLKNVLHLPMSFFDVTPLGRTLARFSSDVNGLDTYFPFIFKGVITTMITVGKIFKCL